MVSFYGSASRKVTTSGRWPCQLRHSNENICALAVLGMYDTGRATIKGFNRSTVSVELQSAGNVEVSVIDMKGSTVAKISAKNLQADFHNLNWNSTNVPSGHYLISVKHNGTFSGKSVILK